MNSLRQQSKLSEEAATEAAAEAAKLQQHSQMLSQQLDELKQKSTNAELSAQKESHMREQEVICCSMP